MQAASARAAQAACWGESMRGRQGETHRGSCWRSRAIMPYNSVATRMKISDSSVARHPASRPHQKSTPPNPAERELSMLVKKMDTAVARAHSAWLWVKDGCSLGASAGKTQHHALHTADAPFCRRGQWCAAQQQAREKETHGRQRCWASGILGPGAACGGAPRTLGRASAAGTSSRRPTKPAFSFLGVHMQGCFYGQRGALKTHTVLRGRVDRL